MLGLLADNLDDYRFVSFAQITLALAGHPGPALAAEIF